MTLRITLTVFGDYLYCVHRGGKDNKLWWTRWNGSSWSPDTQLPDHLSDEGPAILAYRDRNATEDQLLCVHRGH